MNYKARYNRIKERVSSMSVTEKAEIVCGLRGPVAGEGAVSCRTQDEGEGLIKTSQTDIIYPSPSMLACSFDADTVRKSAASFGRRNRVAGRQLVIGPSAAVMRSVLDGRNSERFSEEPFLTGKMAAAFLNGLRDTGVEGCLTELGCAHSEERLYSADHIVDPDTFGELYLESFRIAVRDGEPSAVMLSPGKVNGRYIWLDSELLGRLRKETGFDGTVILPRHVPGDRISAMSAGADLLTGASRRDVRNIETAVRKNYLSRESLDNSAIRVSALMENFGDIPVITGDDIEAAMSTARNTARESMVLLKNEDGMLPLLSGEKIAVIGCAAEDAPRELPGLFSTPSPCGTSLLDGFRDCGTDFIYEQGYNTDGSTNPDLIARARDAVKEAGKGIVAIGLPEAVESEGYDRKDMKLPDGILRLIDFLITDGYPLACVVMTASPVNMPFEYGMKAILYCGYCGSAAGLAAADIITGRANPSGHLSFSWPVRASMTAPESSRVYSEGMATGHRARELGRDFEGYPFGYGMGYAPTEFLGARIDKHVIIGEHQRVDILFRVKNSGERAAAFVPQVYLRRGSSTIRKMVAFRKIYLLPGQIKNEHIEVEASDFMIRDPKTGDRVFCAGQYTLELAQYCADDGILDSFEMSVFPKEWNSVSPLEERTGMNSEVIRNAGRSDAVNTADRNRDEVTFREADRTMPGRTLNAELRSVLEETERLCHDEWEKAVTDLPIMTFNSMTDAAVDPARAARAARAAVRKNTGGRWFGG